MTVLLFVPLLLPFVALALARRTLDQAALTRVAAGRSRDHAVAAALTRAAPARTRTASAGATRRPTRGLTPASSRDSRNGV
ncbi:hypothetical protein KMT30_26400 [Streptomyces sp. IBSBF 2953]|nr:hypothetical protein [Streptomyces hayashii]